MERNNNHTQQHGSGNGFLLGVIVGVILTLLFTTKRGRAILKDILEKGAEKFANLEQVMRETAQEDDYLEDDEEEGDDYVAEPVSVTEPAKTHKVEKQTEVVSEPEEKTPPPKQVKETPKFLDETLTEDEAPEEESAAREPEEEKPKTARVKRLFRGLRKKN